MAEKRVRIQQREDTPKRRHFPNRKISQMSKSIDSEVERENKKKENYRYFDEF